MNYILVVNYCIPAEILRDFLCGPFTTLRKLHLDKLCIFEVQKNTRYILCGTILV